MTCGFRQQARELQNALCITIYHINPASISLFKVNLENTRTMCEICLKLKIRTQERHSSGVFINNFEQILSYILVSSLLTLNM